MHRFFAFNEVCNPIAQKVGIPDYNDCALYECIVAQVSAARNPQRLKAPKPEEEKMSCDGESKR